MSTTRWVLIEPHDTVFFRDGRPFNQDDDGAAHIASLFPPPPRSIAHMMRTALAAGRGWTRGDWGREIATVLGDGPDNIGKLCFRPPAIVRCSGKSIETLYPAPLALVARFGGGGDRREVVAEVERLAFPARTHASDIGAARLPRLGGRGWKGLDGWYVTHDGLQRFLDGGTPEPANFSKLDQLARTERRIGIARDATTRQARHGALYATDHRRLGGPDAWIAIRCGFDGAQGWPLAKRRPFGGEHRFVWIEDAEAPRQFRDPAQGSDDPVHYLVVAISAVLPADNGWKTPGARLDTSLPGRIESACVGKPVMLGGWHSLGGQHFGPQPLQPHLPAGSMWLMRASRDEFSQAKLPGSIGQLQEFGYGGCVYGSAMDHGVKAS